MIISHGGIQADVSQKRLPSDAIPALGAYSLNRQVRKLHSGQYFRYRQESGGEYDFPARAPDLSEDVFVVKIYDQKSKHNYAPLDAVQTDPLKQPKLRQVGNNYEAVFKQSEHLDIPGISGLLGIDFTITATGDGGIVPSPMIGFWSESDKVTLEPSSKATRFTFNSILGTIASSGRTFQCFSGEDPRQNGNRVISLNGKYTQVTVTESGDVNVDSPGGSFTHASIGRADDRFYSGSFLEATFHLGDITNLGAEQIFTTMKEYYGN